MLRKKISIVESLLLNGSNSYSVDEVHIKAFTIQRVSRCQAVFQGSLIRARTICRKVISKIQLTSIISSPKSTCSKFQQNILGIMGIQYRPPPQRRGIWCKWDTPASRWLKLNFDGSDRDGRIIGGGVVRDDEGRFILGYSIYFGEGSNNREEFLALAEGLRLCQAFEFRGFVFKGILQLLSRPFSSARLIIGDWFMSFMNAFKNSIHIIEFLMHSGKRIWWRTV